MLSKVVLVIGVKRTSFDDCVKYKLLEYVNVDMGAPLKHIDFNYKFMHINVKRYSSVKSSKGEWRQSPITVRETIPTF